MKAYSVQELIDQLNKLPVASDKYLPVVLLREGDKEADFEFEITVQKVENSDGIPFEAVTLTHIPWYRQHRDWDDDIDTGYEREGCEYCHDIHCAGSCMDEDW